MDYFLYEGFKSTSEKKNCFTILGDFMTRAAAGQF